ncbi:MAG: hypothetical protein KF760_21935 [Candidatus Eremiobacteraeota bacterium]|nr:hypothetical protein [Candidatus Eremiobacteraeota bacterium]
MNFDNATESAKEQLENVKAAAGEKVGEALDAANARLNTAGEKISEAGAKLWENAPEGRIGDAIGAAAAQVESAGEFLAEASVQEISQDLAGFVRKHPLQSLAAGLVVGGLIGMAFSRARGAWRA